MNKGLRNASIDNVVELCRARFVTLPPYLNELRKEYVENAARWSIDIMRPTHDIGDYESFVVDITNKLNEGGTIVR